MTEKLLQVLDLEYAPVVPNSHLPVLKQALVNMLIHTSISIPALPSFSKGQSFLISRRIGSGSAFLPSRKLAHFRTASSQGAGLGRALLANRISIPIDFGCFYHKILCIVVHTVRLP
jgi:hypothetical protein